MSLLALDLFADAVADKPTRRALINAICERTPTGPGKGQRSAKKSRHVSPELGRRVAVEGASAGVCEALGIPPEWAERCEDAAHVGHDDTRDALDERLERLLAWGALPKFNDKMTQLGSYGGGNHFGECEAVQVADNERARRAAEVFGLRDGSVAFLSHCGPHGFGHNLASPRSIICSSTHWRWRRFRRSFPARRGGWCTSSAITSRAARYWRTARRGCSARGRRARFGQVGSSCSTAARICRSRARF